MFVIKNLIKSPKSRNLAICAMIFVCVYLFGAYVFPVAAPFIIALIISKSIARPVDWANKQLRVPRWIGVLFFILLIGSALVLAVFIIVQEIMSGGTALVNFFKNYATYDNMLAVVKQVTEVFTSWTDMLPMDIVPEDFSIVPTLTETATTFLKEATVVISNATIKIVPSIPYLIISIIIVIASSFYMAVDSKRIGEFLHNILPDNGRNILDHINKNVFKSFGRLIWSYVLISVICFVEMGIGFLILGVSKPLALATLIAVIDILPIIGSGGILVPWGIYQIILGNSFLGIGLIVLWIVICIVRQIIEPKIVGTTIGLHPLATLISLYIGARLMGIMGMVLFPITTILIVQVGLLGENTPVVKPPEVRGPDSN